MILWWLLSVRFRGFLGLATLARRGLPPYAKIDIQPDSILEDD